MIPGNDDAIRSCQVVLGALGDAIGERRGEWQAEFEAKQAEEVERRRKEDEERKPTQGSRGEGHAAKPRRPPASPSRSRVPEATWKGDAPKEDPELPPRGGRGGRPAVADRVATAAGRAEAGPRAACRARGTRRGCR